MKACSALIGSVDNAKGVGCVDKSPGLCVRYIHVAEFLLTGKGCPPVKRRIHTVRIIAFQIKWPAGPVILFVTIVGKEVFHLIVGAGAVSAFCIGGIAVLDCQKINGNLSKLCPGNLLLVIPLELLRHKAQFQGPVHLVIGPGRGGVRRSGGREKKGAQQCRGQ